MLFSLPWESNPLTQDSPVVSERSRVLGISSTGPASTNDPLYAKKAPERDPDSNAILPTIGYFCLVVQYEYVRIVRRPD